MVGIVGHVRGARPPSESSLYVWIWLIFEEYADTRLLEPNLNDRLRVTVLHPISIVPEVTVTNALDLFGSTITSR